MTAKWSLIWATMSAASSSTGSSPTDSIRQQATILICSESGTLYAAKFEADGSGKWLELSEAATGMSKPEICIYSRIAASKVGATTMDRPEWVVANPNSAEVYCALTNNKNRGKKTNAGGDATPAEGPNPSGREQLRSDRALAPDR